MYKNNEKVWNNNTHLSVNLKTQLRSDRTMKVGKGYPGILKRDVECDEFLYDEHFTFTETLPWNMKRNPKVFNGKFISVTRQDDGTYRPNFKPMPKHGANLSFMYPDRDEPGERLFLQLQRVLPTLQHHQLPPDCKDFWRSFNFNP